MFSNVRLPNLGKFVPFMLDGMLPVMAFPMRFRLVSSGKAPKVGKVPVRLLDVG